MSTAATPDPPVPVNRAAWRSELRETMYRLPSPPAVTEVKFITDEEARGMAEAMRQRAAADPVFAEDIASITESMPYVVRMQEGTRPVRCECCGTLVTQCPEAEASETPWAFKPAVWERDAGRKHTLRRCDWMRDHGVPAAPESH